MKLNKTSFLQIPRVSSQRHLLYLLLITTVLMASPCNAVTYDVMLDVSGSMRGFKKEAATWKQLLNNLEASARHKYQFGDRHNFMRIEGSLTQVRLRDNKTYLGQALKSWVNVSEPDDVVIVLTDNVADTMGNSAQSQDSFYDLFSQAESPFSHVAIYPMTLPFNGKVYPLGNGRSKRYKGPRALSTYAVARNVSDEQFDQLCRHIETQLAGFNYKYIQIKPFDSSTVSGLVGDIKIETDPTQYSKVSFETDGQGKKRLMVRQLQVGEEIDFAFGLKIQSSNSFELHNIELQAQIQLFTDENMQNSFNMTDNFSAQVNPRYATISPNDIKDISVIFKNEAFDYGDLSFFEKLAFTVKNSMTIQGNLDITFKASREQMHLSQGIVSDWSYEGNANNLDEPSADVQQKVYKLGQLVQRMLPQGNEIQKLHSVPITLELRYPLWPLLMAILAVLTIIAFLIWLIVRPSKVYLLQDELGHQLEMAAGLGQTYRHYSNDGQFMFSLRSLGLGFWVSSPFQLRSPRFISSGQHIRLTDPDMGDEYNWQLREMMATTQEQVYDDDMDDW